MLKRAMTGEEDGDWKKHKFLLIPFGLLLKSYLLDLFERCR